MSWLIPIGVSNFEELVNTVTTRGEQYLYVDKTLFIRDVLDREGAKVVVLTRPRRFGKTLNLSMLQHFLSATIDGKPTKQLFDGLNISKEYACCEKYQGKYPVIFITFADVKRDDFQGAIEKIAEIINILYTSFIHVAKSDKLEENEKEHFMQMISATQIPSITLLESSIGRLSYYLSKYYGKNPYILIDEYDTPIQAAYLKGYYEEVVGFFRNLFSGALKTNEYYTKAVLTGITRVSKESLFSGVNNLYMYSVLSKTYAEYFGFTQDETDDLITRAGLPAKSHETKEWYNGYVFGNTTIYNPWSIVHFIRNEGALDPYWVNTSSEELIKDLIIKSDSTVKEKLQRLLAGEVVESYIDDHIVFPELKNNNAATIWSLLLMTGYLKQLGFRRDNYSKIFSLQIPNKEISFIYTKIISNWLAGTKDLEWYSNMLQDLITGRFANFEDKLKRVMWNIASTRDVPSDTKELFYHGLMLGLITGLIDTYEVKSDKESGAGMYDICLAPRDNSKYGIVIELKAIDKSEQKQLEAAANAAMSQIEQKRYVTELIERGVNRIYKVAIAFSGKELKVIANTHNAAK